MDLLERIDQIRANSVTPERFERVWGISLEQHLDELMEFIEREEERCKREDVRGKM